jgi:hypothetical protein
MWIHNLGFRIRKKIRIRSTDFWYNQIIVLRALAPKKHNSLASDLELNNAARLLLFQLYSPILFDQISGGFFFWGGGFLDFLRILFWYYTVPPGSGRVHSSTCRANPFFLFQGESILPLPRALPRHCPRGAKPNQIWFLTLRHFSSFYSDHHARHLIWWRKIENLFLFYFLFYYILFRPIVICTPALSIAHSRKCFPERRHL